MSSHDRKNEMAISEAELNSMTRELDMLHKETFPGVKKTLEEFTANLSHLRTEQGFGRRSFLVGLGGAAVIGGVAACSSSGGSKGSSTGASTPAAGSSSGGGKAGYTGDLKIVGLAAALENLGVAAYGMALQAAQAGKLGKVPPAVGNFATVAMMQHKDHAAGWNAVLAQANVPKVTTPALTITNQQVAMLKSAKNVVDVAKLALAIEDVAAETYTFAIGNVKDAGGIMTAATIQPVEAMHAAILNFVLGQYPVPTAYIQTDKSLKPEMFTG